MSPSLTYIDSRTGDLVEQHTLAKDLHKLSIRHLGVTPGGTVVFGCQHKGGLNDVPSLIGTHRRGASLKLIEMPGALSRAMRTYVGSIDVDRGGDYAVATSPRGGTALIIDVAMGRILDRKNIRDVSGVSRTRDKGRFIMTDGHGMVTSLHPRDHGVITNRVYEGVSWDNHVASCSEFQ